MMQEVDYQEELGPVHFMPWSKRNAIWTVFYRTVRAGHWCKDDVDEFNGCGYIWEAHFDHKDEDRVHLACLEIMRRRPEFKAIKVSVLAVSDMKCIIMLAKKRSPMLVDKIATVLKANGAELYRVTSRDRASTEYERESSAKVREYMDALGKAFAPMGVLTPVEPENGL